MNASTSIYVKQSIQYCLLDIEGTTTDIDFVSQVLFPYAAKHMEQFIKENQDSPDVQHCLNATQATVKDESNRDLSDEETVAVLLQWIEDDRKHTALKQLQGMIWKTGYYNADYEAHVYPDVPEVLKEWQSRGLQTGIYSSGSVEAQKLLFLHTSYGDLTSYLSHYFDTRIGHKKDAAAYKTISQKLACPPQQIMFFSDSVEELQAAENVGFNVLHVIRDASKTQETIFKNVNTLDQVQFLI